MPIYRQISARIVTKRVPEMFLRRFIEQGGQCRSLTIVSPWIAPLHDSQYTLGQVVSRIRTGRVPTYVITRPPALAWHREAVEILMACPYVEVNFNEVLHAKFFVCEREPYGYALLGTANLTMQGITGYEVGIMIEGTGGGQPIVDGLRDLGQITLRSLKETQCIKRIERRKERKP